MADGSAPKPYSPQDVEDMAEEIAEAYNAGNNACTIPDDFIEEARAVLDALAEAGRLRPVPFDLGNPLGWSPEQIRAAEERSNELDKLIDRGSDG